MPDLRTARRARGMTQLDLSARSGVALRTIQRLEHGLHRPQRATERAIRWALR